VIARGTCHTYFAFLAASQVDLGRAQAIARAVQTERPRFQRHRRAPAYLDFDPLPLQITMPCEPIPVAGGRFACEPSVDVTLFDFGALSVDYRVRFAAGLDELAALSSALYEDERLLAAARLRVGEIVEAIRPALSGERPPEEHEEYSVFDVEAFEPALAPADLLAKDALRNGLAQILRAEKRPLSESRVAEALRLHVSYAPDDLLVVDWSNAVAVGGSEDERLVLEFANLELLELRSLDKQLDGHLELASRRLQRRRGRIFAGSDLRAVAGLQVDAAMLYESVNNAVSLLGDQWLADVYELIAERYDLEKWEASVAHKLASLESIYQKIADHAAVRRSEVLEMVIIALIALEVRWGALLDTLRGWFQGGP
jgi:hypothetical protein